MSRECWRRLQVRKTQKSEKQLLFYGYLQKDTSTIGVLVFLHPQAIKSYNYYQFVTNLVIYTLLFILMMLTLMAIVRKLDEKSVQ